MTAANVTAIPTRSLKDRVDPAEWETRVELAAAYRLVYRHGWATTLIFNHISARVPGNEDHFLLNPYGLRYDEVTASNLVKIDLDGKVLDDSPYEINAAGYVIHSAIHAARHDVQCVIHTHTEDGMALSSLEEGLLYTNQETFMFWDNIARHPFEGIAIDTDERERLVANMGGAYAMILDNHGLLTAGRTIGEAFYFMFFLEKAASSQLKMMASGGTLYTPERAVAEHTAAQFDVANRVQGDRAWPALLRALDATDPDYRD
jgi:ribulose-5-phosphate 4-epimerase/fuculose-1-phosphate aldolase